jgi:ribosomal protein L11 methyltransferase
MPSTQLTLTVGPRDPGPFEDALLALGADAVTLEDAADDPVLEPRPGEMPLWPTVRVKAVWGVALDASGWCQALGLTGSTRITEPDLLAAILACLAAQGCAVAGLDPPLLETLDDRAWEREWLRDFKPMRFGRRLWICPDGQAPNLAPGDDRTTIVRIDLDPGLAFGTGTHPTTRLCLEWLDANLPDREPGTEPGTRTRKPGTVTVIDYGCGSGVLAIAALKLGASHATGVDIDPQALLASAQNAQRNGVQLDLQLAADIDARAIASPPITPTTPTSLAPADLVLANILAGPLVELAPRLAGLVHPGGRIVLAGLLAGQAAAVTAAYRPWFDIGPSATRDGWTLISGRRHAP